LSRREIRAFSLVALFFGFGISYLGATTSCACPEQTVGQPLPFNWLMAEVDAGLVVIILSTIGFAFSFLKKETTASESGGTDHSMSRAGP